MATSTAELELRTTVDDQASGKIGGLGTSFGKLTAAIGLGSLAAMAFQKATSFVTGAIEGSIKAAEDAQVSHQKVDAILKTLSDTTTFTSKKTTEFTQTVGLSSAAIEKINVQITAKQHALEKLSTQLKAGKIDTTDYGDKVAALKLQISDLKGKLDDTTTSHKKLHDQVTLNGIAFDVARKAVDEAGKAALKLGFDDEAAEESMAKLLQVTRDAKEAHEAEAAAMDLARFKGIGLDEATQAMVLAMNGNVRVLKQLGIEIPDNADKMTVLGLVHDRVAGQAKAFASTAAGSAEIYKQAMENLQESIGNRVLPIVSQFYNRVAAFVSGDKLQGWISTIASGFRAVGDFIKTTIIPLINNEFMPIWSAIGDALKQVYQQLLPYIPTLKEIGKFILAVDFTVLIGGIKVISLTVLGLIEVFKTLISWIKELFDWIDKVVTKFADFQKNVIGKVGSAAGNVGDFFKNLFKAEGGPISAGQPYIVGEKGPELIVPRSNATVMPAGSFGGGANVTININGSVNDSNLSQIVTAVKSVLDRELKLANMGAT